MGKKPVVGLIGLVWAGIALSGSGCCNSCGHKKYNAQPAFGSSSPPPGMIGDARPNGAAIPPAGRPDAGGAGMTHDVRPAGTGAMGGMHGGGLPAAPAMPGATQETLRPSHDRFGAGGAAMPGRHDDLGSRLPSTPPRFDTTSGDRRGMTPPPMPVTRSTPAAEVAPLPPAPLPDTAPPGTSGRPLPEIRTSSTPPLPGDSTPLPPPGMPR